MRGFIALVLCGASLFAQKAPSSTHGPEDRAVAHLVREVPAWSRENGCFSCHNNGDGARALFVAGALGYPIPDEALADTLRWLRAPSAWDKGAKHPMASDTKLARIQFATALSVAYQLGVEQPAEKRLENAELLVKEQSEDGAWHVDTGDMVGSPITWGTALATAFAVSVLETADEIRFAFPIERARKWLRELKPENNLQRAALLLAFPSDAAIHAQNLSALLAAQTSDGGWGPQPKTPAEPFDTAIVLLALKELETGVPIGTPVVRGRQFLLATQLENGGWPETTRPSGNASYAHHVSTSAWATMALLRTNPELQ